MFYHRFSKSEGHKVLAVCDEDILGEVIEDGDILFEVKKSFYGGDLIARDDLVEMAEKSTVINAVGNEVVDLLVENNFFDGNKVLFIDDVKHAQFVKI